MRQFWVVSLGFSLALAACSKRQPTPPARQDEPARPAKREEPLQQAKAVPRETLYAGKPLEAWLQGLRNDDPKIRRQAAEVLGTSGEDAAIGPLTEKLKDPNVMVRYYAADGLRR